MQHSALRPVAPLFALLVLAPALAFAQPAPAPDVDARRLFDEGVALLQSQQFPEAVRRLEQARALREAPAVLLNLALAQRGSGRYVDADRTVARYLELAAGRIDAQRRAEVDALRADVLAAIGQLTIRVEQLPSTVTVELDGRRLGDAELNRPIPVDPVVHVVRLAGASIEEQEVRRPIARGEHAEVALALRPLPLVVPPVRPAVQPAPAPPIDARLRVARVDATQRREARGITSRWWFWTGLGAIATAGVTTVLVFTLSGTEAPIDGSLGRTVQAAVTF